MSKIWIQQFTSGLDTRRLMESAPAGSLFKAVNCHINRGGELEQRADFVEVADLGSSICGMAKDKDGLVFYGGTDAILGLPPGSKYQQLSDLNGSTPETITSWAVYKGKVFLTCKFADGNSFMFYDGELIDDPQAPPFLEGSTNPSAVLVAAEKVFVAAGSTLFFSAVSDATTFSRGEDAEGNPIGVGAGFIDMSTHSTGATEITALATYQDKVAVISPSDIQFWTFDPDPDISARGQIMGNTGTSHQRSLLPYGSADVFYLDQNGIKSLRVRDSSGAAGSEDVGSPIDDIVIPAARNARVVTAAEPKDGRLWFCIGDRIFVLSLYSGSGVSAWSEYRAEFQVDEIIPVEDRLWLLSNDGRVFVYGGQGDTYQYSADVSAEVWTPFMDTGTPSMLKKVEGLDAALRGEWEVRVALELLQPDSSDYVAVLDQTTYSTGRVSMQGQCTHASMRFKSLAPLSAVSPARLSSATLHFERTPEEE
jgi:hypothetical protein